MLFRKIKDWVKDEQRQQFTARWEAQKVRIKIWGLKNTGSSIIMGGLSKPTLFLMVKRNDVEDADV